MRTPLDESSIHELASLLAEFSRLPVRVEERQTLMGDLRIDAIIRLGDDRLLLKWKRTASAPAIAGTIRQLEIARSGNPALIPLIGVPYMPPASRRLAAEHGVSWIDLSGNAHLRTPNIFIHVEGKRRKQGSREQRTNPFSPKSSRIARWFLMHPGEEITGGRLADATSVDRGHVSRVLRQLDHDSLIVRQGRAFATPRPELLLDSWRAEYDFRKHEVSAGHLSSRSGQETLSRVTNSLNRARVDYAATGLAGAWLLTHFASFRLVTIFVRHSVPAALLADLNIRRNERGANIWLVTPNDEGVFTGARDIGETRVAHPVQIYLDLAAHPERAEEAAGELRRLLRKSLNVAP